MGRIRDIIQEIDDIRKRRSSSFAMNELMTRLFSLEQTFKSFDNENDSELIRYFPVALIACVEGYFRMAIRDLIDSGDPYFGNAEKIVSSLKLDFSMLRAIHGRKITVGELVAHNIQLSKLDHIDKTLTNLIGKNFFDELRTTTDRWAHEVMKQPIKPILDEPDQVFANMARIFELRHIICHEIASAYEINFDEIYNYFNSCVIFLKASNELISEIIYPGSPLTQTDMNIIAGDSLRKKDLELNEAINSLQLHLDDSEKVAFSDSQLIWQKYCDSWANFVAGERKDSGTIWPVIYAGTKEAVIEQRLNQINSFNKLSDKI